MEDRFCRDSMYPTHQIESFPLEVKLKSHYNSSIEPLQDYGELCLVFNYARFSDLTDCQRLFNEAAARGDNVGVDEYKEQKDFDDLFERSEIFIGRQKGITKAFVLISPNVEVRSHFDTCMASIYIIYASDLDQNQCTSSINKPPLPIGESYYQQLLRLAVNWVQAIDLGYTHICVRVAACCQQRIKALKREDFEILATIPYSVDISGLGITADYLFMKKLDEPTKHVIRTKEAVSALVDCFYPSNADFNEKYQKAVLPHVPFLPQEYVFANGTHATIRNARKDEDKMIYDIFKISAANTDGYDANEYASIGYFRASKMMSYYCIMFEETSTGRIIGCAFTGDSIYTRSARSRMAISSMILTPEFQNKGFGREMIVLDVIINRQLGYRAMINDVLANNDHMSHVLQRVLGDKIQEIGRIPNGSYCSKRGWEDLLVRFYTFDGFDLRDLEDIAQQSVRDHQRKIRNERFKQSAAKL